MATTIPQTDRIRSLQAPPTDDGHAPERRLAGALGWFGIGLGNVGRRALLELRCRFLDRFGDLGKIPLLRFLYIDTDPQDVKTAVRGADEFWPLVASR